MGRRRSGKNWPACGAGDRHPIDTLPVVGRIERGPHEQKPNDARLLSFDLPASQCAASVPPGEIACIGIRRDRRLLLRTVSDVELRRSVGIGSAARTRTDSVPGPNDALFPGDAGHGEDGRAEPEPEPPRAAPLIETFELEGGAAGERGSVLPQSSKSLDTWLPAGAHAEAVVLAGVDASAGISSQGDPHPVLLRLTGPAWTAAPSSSGDATALRVDLAGCTVPDAAPDQTRAAAPEEMLALRTPLTRSPEPRGSEADLDAGLTEGACRTGCGPFAWVVRWLGLESGAVDGADAAETAAEAAPTQTPAEAVAEASGLPLSVPAIGSDEALREAEVIGRIWIAPFVDGAGVYREGSYVRAVLEPAGWRRR